MIFYHIVKISKGIKSIVHTIQGREHILTYFLEQYTNIEYISSDDFKHYVMINRDSDYGLYLIEHKNLINIYKVEKVVNPGYLYDQTFKNINLLDSYEIIEQEIESI